MKVKLLLHLSTLSAILPMIIGSLIFWTWFFYPELKDLWVAGLLTILISLPLCTAGLILALIFKWKNKGNGIVRRKANRTILLIVLNIPASMFYVWFVLY